MKYSTKERIKYQVPPTTLKHYACNSAIIPIQIPSTRANRRAFEKFIPKLLGRSINEYSNLFHSDTEFPGFIDIDPDLGAEVQYGVGTYDFRESFMDINIVSTHDGETVRINRKVTGNDIILNYLDYFSDAVEHIDEIRQSINEAPSSVQTFPIELFSTLEDVLSFLGITYDNVIDDVTFDTFAKTLLTRWLIFANFTPYQDLDTLDMLYSIAGFMIDDETLDFDSVYYPIYPAFKTGIFKNNGLMAYLYLTPDETKRLTFNNQYDVECTLDFTLSTDIHMEGIKFTINKNELPPINNESEETMASAMSRLIRNTWNMVDPDVSTSYLDFVDKPQEDGLGIVDACHCYFDNLKAYYFYNFDSAFESLRDRLKELTEDDILLILYYFTRIEKYPDLSIENRFRNNTEAYGYHR